MAVNMLRLQAEHESAKRALPFGSARSYWPNTAASLWKLRGGTRTPDPVINSHLLYHLSYSGIALKISQSDDRNQPTRASDSRQSNSTVILRSLPSTHGRKTKWHSTPDRTRHWRLWRYRTRVGETPRPRGIRSGPRRSKARH